VLSESSAAPQRGGLKKRASPRRVRAGQLKADLLRLTSKLFGVRRLSRGLQAKSFAQERDMSAIVQSWLLGQRLRVKAEYVSPWGICDFVGLSFDPQRVRTRLRLRQRRPIGSLLRVTILHRIPDEQEGSTTLRRLQHEFASLMEAQQLAEEVTKLAAGRFVRILDDGRLQKLNGWAPLHRRIVAVELKLSRVQEALAQATSHLRFATEVFVAFPTPLAQRIVLDRRAHLFHSAGVGILAVSEHGCRAVLRPREREFLADPILQAHCVERFWRTGLIGTEA
jgi:hypothetical protein